MESIAEEVTMEKPVATAKKKKPRIPMAMRFIRWIFPKLESIAPRYAHSLFIKMFFAPPRYPIPVAEKEILQRAETFLLNVDTHTIQVYTWGNGPAIVLVHGWAGRASQFRSIIEGFSKNGYQVIAFDAPAHGRSSGRKTNIFEFRNTILALERKVGNVHAILAHSIGGTATMFALTEGLQTTTVVTIATPSIGDEIIHEFAARLNGSRQAEQKLKAFIQQSFNRSFDELTAAHFAQQLKTTIDWLIVHDEHDKEASLKNAWMLQQAYPKATLKITSGLGHVRILRDQEVVEACLDFIRSKSLT
jgi:pimeloyl-ACP methyl ester carboxylesterase